MHRMFLWMHFIEKKKVVSMIVSKGVGTRVFMMSRENGGGWFSTIYSLR